MPTQITKNNHYVPRFLTKPWERANRKLRLYNFETNAFESADSKTCFSAREVYPQEIEQFLNRVIESPMNDMLPLVQRGEDALRQERYYRAATLLVAIQRTRSKATTDEVFLQKLIELSRMPQQFLDGLGVEQGHGLSIVSAREGSRSLLFPSTGSFVLLGNDLQWNGQPIAGWGIPIDLKRALVSYDLGLESDSSTKEGIRYAVESVCPTLLEQWSVGTDTSTKVVIPPEFKDSEEELVALLSERRRANMQAILDHNARVAAASKPVAEQ